MGSTIPKGIGFHPSDEVLLSHYLKKKNQDIDSEITAIIPVISVCDYEPGDIPALIKKAIRETEWPAIAELMKMRYFFSPRDYKYTNKCSGRSNRTTKGGFWKITGKVQLIRAPGSNDVIGMKRILTYYEIVEGKPKKTDWVVHEYYHTEAVSGEQIGDYVICRLKNKSEKSDDHDIISKDADLGGLEDADPSSGSSSMASALESVVTGEQGSLELPRNMVVDDKDDDEAKDGGCGPFILSDFEDQHTPNGMLTEAETNRLSVLCKELEDALQIPQDKEEKLKGSTTDSCPIDENGLSNCPEDQTESCNSSDVDMILELHNEPENLGSVLGMPRSPQPRQQQDYPPRILQSTMMSTTKLGNVSPTTDVHKDEFRKRKCPEDNDPSLTKKNNFTTNEFASNTTCSSGIVAAYGTPEVYSQLGEDPGFHSIPSQYYDLLSMDGEQGDIPIDNNFIELDDLSFPFEDINPSAMFSDTDIGGGAVVTEAIQGSVNSNSALATIGASLLCS